MDYPKIVGFIARSERKREILKLLSEGKRSQPEIKKKTKMYKSHTSRILKELLEKKLITCINPEDRTFKFYKITFRGKRIFEKVEEIYED